MLSWMPLREDYLKRNIFVSSTILHKIYNTGLRGKPIAQYGLKSLIHTSFNHPTVFSRTCGTEWWSCPELMEDFVKEMLEYNKTKYTRPNTWIGCHFHTHTDGSPCPAAKK